MPITVNLRYTGTNRNAREFAEEMISSGTLDAIRASQKAIDVHRASPMMATTAILREKYDLHMSVERYNSAENR